MTTEHAHNPENDWLKNALGKNLERDLKRDLGQDLGRDLGQDPQQTLRGQSRENILWDIGVDTGGTFTDCVARHVDGRVARSKVLSTSALRGVVRGGSLDLVVIEFARVALPDNIEKFFDGFVVRALDRGTAQGGALNDGDAHVCTVQSARLLENGHVELKVGVKHAYTPHAVGTFVDVLAPFEAPIFAARLAIGRSIAQSLHDCRICIGTTRGTNALLQGRVGAVTLFVNDGLEDVLRIGDQRRLDIFANAPRKPTTLEKNSVGVNARMTFDGQELVALDEMGLRQRACHAARGTSAIAAVALLHAARNPAHEKRVATILREEGFKWISLSHECGSTSRFEPRARGGGGRRAQRTSGRIYSVRTTWR